MATSTPPPPGPAPSPAVDEKSVRPLVALPRRGPSGLLTGIAILIFGLVLFAVLDARRRALLVPAVRESSADRAVASAVPAPPPVLDVPPPPPPPAPVTIVAPPPPPAPPRAAAPAPRIVYVPQPAPIAPVAPQPAPEPPPRANNDPALVYDATAAETPAVPATGGAGPQAGAGDSDTAAAGIAGARARAGVLANRATTVPQGTLIPAVLETGLDSDRPGLARAMVTRDVRGFDGKNVLVPRGSRLIGEYRSAASQGQKRAFVNWLRLIRPDGVTIAVGSPAGDTLGRGGIKASVDSHFFARFAGAILQSTLDIGVNLASRLGNNGAVILALPGTLQNATQPLAQGQNIPPTLRVKPGTSVTIFVARDLDFTGAESRR